MAKLVMPAMSVEARGKMGGLVYNTWRGIATVKAFKSPTQPKTEAQLAARARMSTYSQAWAGLTTVERDAWETYAESHLQTDWTGKSLRLTSQNWYVGCNCRIALVGGTAITSPPSAAAPAMPTGVAMSFVSGSPGTIKIAWTAPTVATDFIVCYLEGPISAGRTPRKEMASIIGTWAASTTSPHTIVSSPTSGTYAAWVGVIDSLTGLASQLQLVTLAVA